MEKKPITLDQEIAELERELKMRQGVYPDWTKGTKPRLSPKVAQHRLDCLEATIARLKALQTDGGTAPKSEQLGLFPPPT